MPRRVKRREKRDAEACDHVDVEPDRAGSAECQPWEFFLKRVQPKEHEQGEGGDSGGLSDNARGSEPGMKRTPHAIESGQQEIRQPCKLDRDEQS
jgi:hypothetical protein